MCVCVACDFLCAVVCYFIVNREKKRMMFIYYVYTCLCARARNRVGAAHTIFFFKLLVMHQMRVCALTLCETFAPFN